MTIALEVNINGTRYGESEELSAVTIVAEHVGGRKAHRVTVHGQSFEGQLQWLDSHLSIGDQITVRVVEASDTAATTPSGCNFCGREVPELVRLIQGTTVAICDDCTKRFADSLRNGTALPIGASIRDAPADPCGFCGLDPREVAGVVVRNGAAICGQCIRTCEELFIDA